MHATGSVIASLSFTDMQLDSKSAPWYIITANNKSSLQWDNLLLLLAAYSCSYVPLKVAFYADRMPFKGLESFNHVVDAIFFVDLCFNFVRAITNGQGEIVYNLRRIRSNYAEFWLWVDLPGSFPFDDIIEFATKKRYRGLGVLRLMRIGRLMKTLQKIHLTSSLDILRLIGGFALLAHWLGCLWYTIVRPYHSLSTPHLKAGTCTAAFSRTWAHI
jgi:hypothetical protein